jgi:hypothetical protein
MSEEMECKTPPDPSAIKNFLSNIEGFDFTAFETCPDIVKGTMDGGKKRRKTRRKMHGGWPPTRAEIRTALWVVISVLFLYVGATADTTAIRRGLEMVLSGRCFDIAEIGLGWFSMGNPVCTAWRTLVTVVGYALLGSPTAIAQVVGLVAGAVATPALAVGAVDQVAGLIEGRVIGLLGNGNQLAIGNGAPAAIGNGAPAAIGNGDHEHQEGGRRHKRHTRRRKRHTRRHKRHTRRHHRH